MKINVNGEAWDKLKEALPLSELLADKKISPEGTVAALNGQIIKPEDYKNCILRENDSVDLLVFSAGG